MDARVAALVRAFRAHADPEHAEFHKAYHKSERSFHGLKTPLLRKLVKDTIPARPKLAASEVKELAAELWASDWQEERIAALELLARVPAELGPRDLPLIKRMTKGCDGWGLLDHLACNTLSHTARAHGAPIYDVVRGWSKDRWMWTRRASILVHIRAAQKGELSHAHAWPTFEELLPEREFFIRKALGWTLREISKHEPERVHAFLTRVGDRASGLTRREGARNLPPALRIDILGK